MNPSPLPYVLQIVHLPLDLLLGAHGVDSEVDRVDHFVDFFVNPLHRNRRRAHRADRRVLLRQRLAQQHRVAPRLGFGPQSRGGARGRGGGRERGGEIVDEALEGGEQRVGAARSPGDLAVAHEESELDEAGVEAARRGRERIEGSEVLRQRGRRR